MIFGFYQSWHGIGHGADAQIYDFFKIWHGFKVFDSCQASIL